MSVLYKPPQANRTFPACINGIAFTHVPWKCMKVGSKKCLVKGFVLRHVVQDFQFCYGKHTAETVFLLRSVTPG